MEHRPLFDKSTKSCHAWSFFAFDALLDRSALQMIFFYVSNVSSPSGIVFAAFFWGFECSNHDSSCHPGTGFLLWYSLHKLDLVSKRPYFAVVVYSSVQFYLGLTCGSGLVDFSRTLWARIDGFSSRIWRVRSRIFHFLHNSYGILWFGNWSLHDATFKLRGSSHFLTSSHSARPFCAQNRD